ncbi:MAG: hypothetical protein ACL93V_17070 [Candidatus Electrothrix sp. YB6]
MYNTSLCCRAGERVDKIVGFCGQYVRISCNSPAAAALVDFLCADLQDNQHAQYVQHAKPHAECRLVFSGKESMSLHREGELLYQGECRRELAYALLNEIIFQCLENNDSGPAVHAAAVLCGKKGVLIPGNTGAGKSTFAAWLTACGCGYLTDELVILSGDEYRIQPFTRPVTLRPEAAAALAPYVRFNNDSAKILTGDSGFMVPHRLLNPAFTPATPRPALILFPRFRAGARTELTKLTPGRGCSRLMECYVNARNIPGHGISGLARLSRDVPILQLTYGSFAGLRPLLADALPEFFRDTFS